MLLADDPDEREFRAELRRWLRANLPPADPGPPRRWTVAESRAWSRSVYEAGYAGLTWPTGYGGRGLSPTYQGIYAEECARAEAPDAVDVIGLNMVGPAIIRYGTTEQKVTHLPRILSGDSVFCQGFSEPDAGSDLAAIRSTATPESGGYRLDGEKLWSSYAHLADHCLLLARTDPRAPRHDGLTCLLVDLRAPGVEVRPLRQMSGDTEFSQLRFAGVRVGRDAALGPVGAGWSVAMTTLAHERGTFGVALVARLARELDRLVRTVRAVGADRDPLVRRDIAELHVALQGLRCTGYRTLAAIEGTGEPGPESTIVKLRWSVANQRVCRIALAVLDRSRADDERAERWRGYWQQAALRSRGNSIEGGTSEILRGVVAERVLGLTRSR